MPDDSIYTGQAPKLFVAKPNRASRQAEIWLDTRPDDAALMDTLSNMPMARWFTGRDDDIKLTVHAYVTAAHKTSTIPALVAYNIPDRDVGQYSRGGAHSTEVYGSWITKLAQGIGTLPAIIILEPDALAHLEQLPESTQAIRCNTLWTAISTFRSLAPYATLYLDAGHPGWQTPATMAGRLEQAGIQNAAGFSINVSNFCTTQDCITFGTELSNLVGGKHYLIDTSRNGNGPDPDGKWCNPGGRALGHPPTLVTGNPNVDAFLWVKIPGESDGNSGEPTDGVSPPAAGEWWPEYALELARNAGWGKLQTSLRQS